jgi:hypothetical protein
VVRNLFAHIRCRAPKGTDSRPLSEGDARESFRPALRHMELAVDACQQADPHSDLWRTSAVLEMF